MANLQLKEISQSFSLIKVQQSTTREYIDIPTIYAITPTYTRLVQKAELVRVSQTFLHIKNFLWIVVEDSDNKTALVANLLHKSGINYTHLNVRTPQKNQRENHRQPGRGSPQRNLGLEWVRGNDDIREHPGVVYFADDDNVYRLQLFDEVSICVTFHSPISISW